MGLTAKRRAFANAIVSGMNPSEAYREAGYSCRMGSHAIAVEAQRILKDPDVSLLIESGRKEASEKAVWSREKALERLSAVNDMTYRHMTENGLADRESASGFFQSLDRLQAMTYQQTATSDQIAGGAFLQEIKAVFAAPVIINHTEINGEIVTRERYNMLADTLRTVGLGEIIDAAAVIDLGVCGE